MMNFFSESNNQNDWNKLSTFYKNYSPLMYKVAKRILNDEHLAQDAVQEAFINIYNNYEKIIQTDCNKIRTLFVIIVRNISIDFFRSRKKESYISLEDITEELFESEEDLAEILIREENFGKIAEKLSELHPTYSDILTLKLFHQYNNEEISKILNISPENTRTRLHRARKNLIKLLSQEQEERNHG